MLKMASESFIHALLLFLGLKPDKFWKSKMHLRNQTPQNLEIKIAIREIKRDKFKIKMTQ